MPGFLSDTLCKNCDSAVGHERLGRPAAVLDHRPHRAWLQRDRRRYYRPGPSDRALIAMAIPNNNYTVQLPVYAGPLDLLLQLIERDELDITRVSLAQVTDQFLAYLKVLETMDLGDIADFLVIAARLILIKSEALLPRPVERQPGEEDPGDELARLLIAYKRYKEIAGTLRQREEAGLRTYLRLAPPPKMEAQLDLSGVTTMH